MTPETRFKNKIKKFLDEAGCYHVKFFANNYTKRGIPDILVCCNGYFIGLELKAEKGTPSELQKYNVRKIQEAGGIALILYPKDFEDFKKLIYKLKEGGGDSKEQS